MLNIYTLLFSSWGGGVSIMEIKFPKLQGLDDLNTGLK